MEDIPSIVSHLVKIGRLVKNSIGSFQVSGFQAGLAFLFTHTKTTPIQWPKGLWAIIAQKAWLALRKSTIKIGYITPAAYLL